MGTFDKNFQSALDYLILTQNIDGGWGYHRDGLSYSEPTALVLLALLNPNLSLKVNSADPRYNAVQKGLAWLRQGQHQDGGWGVFHADEISSWMTYPVTWLFNILVKIPEAYVAYSGPEDTAIRDRALKWIIERGREPEITDNAVFNQVKRFFNIDSSFRGWSWGQGEAGWVIPTSLALITLATGISGGLESNAAVQNGKEYLRDRSCPGGGWNVGNPYMLGKQLPPTPDATSFALLAWRTLLTAKDFGDTEQIQKGIAVLNDFVQNSNSDHTIAMGSLALRLLNEQSVDFERLIKGVTREFGPDKVSRKTARGQDPLTGGWVNSPYTTAFAALGLSGTTYFIKPGT